MPSRQRVMGRYFYMDYNITDYNYFGSTVGNACFSGLTIEELFSCVLLSSTREELDAAVSASIKVKEIADGKKK
jgi:hypothetical protein